MRSTILLNICLLLAFLTIGQCYVEKRTFRERSKVFCRLNKQCQRYEEWEYDYNKLFNISEIPNTQPDGYLVRLPFYILADRDAHVIFTETDDPDWQADNAYEIIFGGWENYRTTIRRKKDDQEMKFEYSNHILAESCPLKALIEITTGGDIRIYIEHKLTSVLEARDATPLAIKYVGFASLQHSLAQYFYNCKEDSIYTPKELQTACQVYEKKDDVYTDFFPINSQKQKSGGANDVAYTLFYATARRGLRVLLAKERADEGQRQGYEIYIGLHVQIRKLKLASSELMADVPGADPLTSNRPLTIIIQMTKKGYIKVFAKHDHTQFKLLVSVRETDRAPVKLNYISYASSESNSKINVFHDCPFEYPYIDTEMATKYTLIGHPLLDDPEFKSTVDMRNWLVSKCKYYTNNLYEFKEFFKLSDIEGSQPKGYQARIVFYAQGTRNAHILLSPTNRPNILTDSLYEFVIGGWTNSRVLIRRKKGEETLSQVFILGPMTAHKPTKYIIEVSHSGNIRLYSDHDKTQPIAQAFDVNVLPVNYVSFAGYDTKVDFFYNCK